MTQAAPSLTDRFRSILDSARTLLTGEPARFIGYGAAVVIVGVIAISNALGFTRFGENISLSDALIGATAAIATLGGIIETIRRFVYSQNTVEAIAAVAAETGDATVPPPPSSSEAVTDVSVVDADGDPLGNG
jgi:hypothetical protein